MANNTDNKNEKTGLGIGDTKKLAFLFMIMTIMNVIALVFEPWYEGWGTDDAWEAGDYFDGMFENSNVDVILGSIQTGLYILTAVCAILMIVFFFVYKKVEPKK